MGLGPVTNRPAVGDAEAIGESGACGGASGYTSTNKGPLLEVNVSKSAAGNLASNLAGEGGCDGPIDSTVQPHAPVAGSWVNRKVLPPGTPGGSTKSSSLPSGVLQGKLAPGCASRGTWMMVLSGSPVAPCDGKVSATVAAIGPRSTSPQGEGGSAEHDQALLTASCVKVST